MVHHSEFIEELIATGRLQLDEGARQALSERGTSLLPIGVTAVEGEFARGDVVTLVDAEGNEFARGLVNYNSRDAETIAGSRSEDIAALLGSLPYALCMVLGIILLCIFPGIATWLPDLLF